MRAQSAGTEDHNAVQWAEYGALRGADRGAFFAKSVCLALKLRAPRPQVIVTPRLLFHRPHHPLMPGENRGGGNAVIG